ncbi:platelet binding protein GspB isoform X2 [Venturia canescens]|uniref:platelet binding protein GspB isoform X2 n=1 Tax=Venturia canescens TaxID=32260 RepID=UPI001C9D37C9|nr:platelet binding protein GspB isoform X2 [Venturia canescens]
MATDEKWYFTKEQLANTPSRKCGIDADKELSCRQQAANFIQDMGQRLSVTQLCINTAIVYMHRFYVFHSLSQFHRNAIATAALFLAAKVEEQPRKLEHVIKVAHVCLHKDQPPPDVRSEQYLDQAQDVVFNENVLLQTLGFDVAIDHPHTHVVRCCQLVKASKDLAQASYFMASNSLHMTTMCLQYKPTVVACFCIHLACKWSNWEIPQSNEGKHWFWYVDRSVTSELLQQLTAEFLHIFDNCPSRLKRRIKSISAKQSPSLNHSSLPNSPFDTEPRQVSPAADGGPTFQSSRPFPLEETKKPVGQSSISSSSATTASSSRPPVDYREYREKKERERLEREKAAGNISNAGVLSGESGAVKSHHSHSHHGKQQTGQASMGSSKHPGLPGAKLVSHHNHHGAHRNEGKPSGQIASQRHSSSSSSVTSVSGQSGRPRVPRDYNAVTTGIAGSATASGYQQHGHQSKDAPSNIGMADATAGLGDATASTFEDNHIATEKMSNHGRSIEAKHEKSQQRGYDPRHKLSEHALKESEQKNYTKYHQLHEQQQRSRKTVDVVEQRSEEVRKLIDKPLPVPKASIRPEINSQKDDYTAGMMKQPHLKYGQQHQTSDKQSLLGAAPTVGNVSRNPQEYGLASGGSTRDKASALSKNSQLQPHSNPVSISAKKFDSKSNVKNGNSQAMALIDEVKLEKRSRHQLDDERLQAHIVNQQTSNVQHGVLSQPVKQHKSLFSPEKITNPRESHTRMSRSSRQKTPPSTGNVNVSGTTGATNIMKSSKIHDRVPDQLSSLDHVGSFDNSQTVHQSQLNHQSTLQHQQHHHHHHHQQQQQQHHSQVQNPQESSSTKATSHSKRHRNLSIGDSSKQQQSVKMEPQIKTEGSTKLQMPSIKMEPSIKIEMEDNRDSYESMKMLGRVPEMLQPIREDLAPSNGRGGIHGANTAPSPIVNDLKMPELIKPFEPEVAVRHTSLTNGLDSNVLNKREDVSRDSADSDFCSTQLTRSSQDYLSPIKSAQSISALLQEPLAPMPSLLQGIDDYTNSQQQTSSQTSQTHSESTLSSSQRSYQYPESQDTITTSRDNRQATSGTSYHQQSVQSAMEMSSGTASEKELLSTPHLKNLESVAPVLSNEDTTSSANPVAATNPNPNPSDALGNSSTNTSATSSGPTSATAVSSVSKKSSHHKSDKKKRKEKHKHKEKDKDKEKSRDKKKAKRKEKEKERHIKITIPKDKLNLSSSESASALAVQTPSTNPAASSAVVPEKKSPQTAATGLKIKIPKERLKGNSNETPSQSLVQAPLKIKIRTSVGENSESTVSMSTSSSRKRDRETMANEGSAAAPPSKKPYSHHHHHHTLGTTTGSVTTTASTMTAMTSASSMPTTTASTGIAVTANQHQSQQHQLQAPPSYVQQPGQRQNGRHYSSNNKDKHTSSSHHKSSNKLSQQQQQQQQLQQQQMQLQQQHHQHSHPT